MSWDGLVVCVVVVLLGVQVAWSQLFLIGQMSGKRRAMLSGLPSLRWSTEPKRRYVVVGAKVEEATCSSTSVPSESQLPKFAASKSHAPVLRPSIRGDRSVALSSVSSAASRQLALDGLMSAMSAPSSASSLESLVKTWTSFHMAWFGSSVGVLPLVPTKVFAVCAMFCAGGYQSVENYLSRMKYLHIGGGLGSLCLERACLKSKS